MQTLLFPVYRRIRCKIEIPESRKNIGIWSTAVLREGLAHASYEFYYFTLHVIPVYLCDSGFSNFTSNLAVNRK